MSTFVKEDLLRFCHLYRTADFFLDNAFIGTKAFVVDIDGDNIDVLEGAIRKIRCIDEGDRLILEYSVRYQCPRLGDTSESFFKPILSSRDIYHHIKRMRRIEDIFEECANNAS